MTIDAHQHFWQFDPVRDAWITEEMNVIRRDFLPADLAPLLKSAGIDACVAVQADQSEAETQFLVDCAKGSDIVKAVVGWVDLRSPNVAERLAFWAGEPLVKGFRHIVQGEPDDGFLLREDFNNGIAALKKHGFTYDVLVFPRQLPAVEQFVERHPEQPLVIDHLAKPYIKKKEIGDWTKHIRRIARSPQVHCKLSGMVTEADMQNWKEADFRPYLDTVLEAFGPERLMYGSDWPVCLLAADYARQKSIVDNFISALSASEQQRIMGNNAAAFYNIS
ncbi:amidohydrolase family protein [Chitinophaga rhizosphaerae]|uniref:amidohydrolase family protein n=1 Tax=Chitinophaga rhizosphaerae TaxID=1864947 RepID=UPI000F814611|nr:amidohydrolase family protein [Chitinophaga rhizosphaerae]